MEDLLHAVTTTSNLSDLCDVALTSLIRHAVDYLTSAQTIVTHVALLSLLYGLHIDGCLGRRRLVYLALAEEFLVYVLWLTVAHGLRSVFVIWICLSVYESIVRPPIRLHNKTILLTDVGAEEALAQLGVTFDSTADDEDASNATRRISCVGLRLVAFSRSKWILRQHNGPQDALRLENITSISDTSPDLIVAKRFHALGIESERCLYLSMDADNTTVVLIADNKSRRDSWLVAFQQLVGFRVHDVRYAWLLKLCSEAAATTTGTRQIPNGISGSASCPDMTQPLTPPSPTNVIKVGRNVEFEQALDMLQRAGRPSDRHYARELFKTFASVNGILMRSLSLGNDAKQLTWEQFLAFFSCAANRPEINTIFDGIVDRNQKMSTLSPEKFLDFVKETQKESVTTEDVKRWILLNEPVLQSCNMSYIGFASYILSDEHSIFRRQCREVYQDMSQPLSHYFIATSHNTYLTKDQLTSRSSVDAYINAFKRGCKCVELDIWDGPNGDPIIYHGYTLTSKILAKDVIVAIKEYAFYVSQYPVILSFENHCSAEQQKVIARYLVDILGDALYTKPIPSNEKYLPSPEDLKGYILVKTKKLKVDSDDTADDFFEDDMFDTGDDTELADIILARSSQKRLPDADSVSMCADDLTSTGSSSDGDTSTLKSDGDDEEYDSIGDRKESTLVKLRDAMDNVSKMRKDKEKMKPPKIAQEFSDLVVYCQPTSFRALDTCKLNAITSGGGKHYEMISLNERRAVRLAREDPSTLLQFNQRQLCRVYPAGARIDSSNYDPVALWNAGCQLVALNYQTACLEMQLNDSLFADNGMCGYVLKPEFLRQENTLFDPRVSGDRHDALIIHVISAHQVPYKNEKALRSERQIVVQVRVLGVDADVQCDRTHAVKNNGLNPVWNSTLQFKIYVPQLAFVVFTVLVKNVFVAQYTLPYRCVQQGYRRVPLSNKFSLPFPFSYLLVHVRIVRGCGSRENSPPNSPTVTKQSG